MKTKPSQKRFSLPPNGVLLELCRLPNLFTVPGDILVGWALAGARGWIYVILGILSSLCLYTAGLFLNDVVDAKVDAQERPSRPIPSGRVERKTVLILACALGVLGCLFAWQGVWMAVLLLGLIVVYNLIAKRLRGPFGAIVMGACRGVNVLLGMAVSLPSDYACLSPKLTAAAIFFFVYIAIVTLIARDEVNPKTMLSKYWRWAPAAITLALVPVFWFMGLRPLLPIFFVTGLLVAIGVLRRTTPQLIGAWIRALIPLQALWCFTALPITGVIILFVALYLGALLAARRYAGS